MELTAKQIYASVDDWYRTKFKAQGYATSFISVASMMHGLTAYDYLLTPVDKGRITRAASALNPLLHEYANNPNMTFNIDVLLRHMPAFKMEVFGKYYGVGKREDTLRSILQQINESTSVERELSDPANWDEGDPMRDPVVKWLAETLRPDSIDWALGDPIHCVLIGAMQREGVSEEISTAIRAARELYDLRVRHWHKRPTSTLIDYGQTTKEQAENVARREIAKLVDYVEPIRTGFVHGGFIPAKQDEDTTMQRGFREALHRLVDASADPDPKVFAYVLLTEFGERLRLSNKVPHFMGAVERDTLAHVDSSGRHSVLWASTGGFIYRAVPSHGRELIDWQHPDNVEHLQACYTAHNTPLGDTYPCSHFTSRPH